MACQLMHTIRSEGRWRGTIKIMKAIFCSVFALVVIVSWGGVHGVHTGEEKIERLIDARVKKEVSKIADSINVKMNAEVERKVENKFKSKESNIDRLAKEHISFLTDKINFLTILVTVVFAFFGISSIVVTVTLIEYRDAYNAMCEKSNRAVEAIAVAEKKMFRVQSRTCYHVAKNALVLYKSLNQTSSITEPEKEKKRACG